ncbi:MAG TPA: hypothetical protein EYG98_01195 [Sulfurovum sp.]|nr:hypothetical protein [Sulfurovum sp.]
MKRIFSLVLVGLAVLAFSGCSSGDDELNSKTYYIVDVNGAGISGIAYSCDSSTNGTTNASGSFEVEPVDTCDLDLRTNLITGDIYLEDNNGLVSGIRYECVGNSYHGDVSGFTARDGYIDYATYFTSCTLYNLP